MKFEKLRTGNVSDVERQIREEWGGCETILKKTIDNRSDKNMFVFYDGPIYANAKPGLHHVFAKTIKDAVCKYKTMQGYKVLRKIGLDTHGLPIEVNVEKKLGFKNKSDIEKFGIENFCKECNKETDSNIDEVKKVTEMMGQFIDITNPYITCTNDYIESEWWLIKNIFDKGLIYHGNKVLPYCPRCGTELSQNEVFQGYQQDSVNTVIVPLKLVDEDAYLLVWTTTPWTLIDNVATCVNPDYDYIKASSKGNNFIVCKNLADKVLGEDYLVLETYKGKDLVGKRYEQLMPFAKVEGKAFCVLADSYVTALDGTGIVHIAPSYGEDDSRVAKINGVTSSKSVNKDGLYTVGPWKGRIVTDPELELDIIKYLKENDKLFKKQKITHNYPHCWRCKKPLIYYSKPAWYIETTKLKEKIIECNKSVNWYPSYVGEKRFNNWLEGMVDWGISRNRYWGCPMPIWTCECGHIECIGSLDELQEKVLGDVDVRKIELHRPYVDNIHIECPKCHKSMNRVTDVMDVWFDSGAMPYAQFHYPFENKELFESQFPGDFIAEGVDQTRGWFNSLLCISTLVSGVSSYKNVVVNDMMLDANGKKMSKSVGNIINPVDIMTEYGADPVRYYMLYASPVWTPLRFDMVGLKEIYSKFYATLKNAYSFFEMYANADNIDPREYDIEVKNRELIDKWLLSKLNKLVRDVTNAYEAYDLNKVVKLIVPFLNDDLSNWYIRSNRRRFWDSELSLSKKAVYQTTYEVLVTLSKLVAPITPYISEEIYTKLTSLESVHLADFPKCNEELINEEVEEKMDLVRDICSLGRDARETVNIKVRQPIKEVILASSVKDIIGNLDSIVKEELNVKNIVYKTDMTEYLSYSLKPNFKVLGKELGPKIKLLQEELKKLSSNDAYRVTYDSVIIKLDGEDFTLNSDNTIVSIDVLDGYVASNDSKTCVVLNTELTEDLIFEGLAREVVRKVQSLRKDLDLNIVDKINVYYNGPEQLDKSINNYMDYIKNETLAISISKDSTLELDSELNDIKASLSISKI